VLLDVVRGALAALLLLPVAGSYAASVDPALPRYEPRRVEIPASASYVGADGAIVVVGYNDMRDMLGALVPLFAAAHSDIRIRLDLPGTRFAPAALARGESAFAPMGAEFTPAQLAEYRAAVGADPLEFRVAHASLDPLALSGPLAVFVHRDNPLASVTVDQLRRVYTGETSRWGELGLDGAWAERAVHSYGVERGTPLALSFQRNAMEGAAFGERMTGFGQSSDVVQKVASDPAAIGFAAAMRAVPGVRVVPIAPRGGGAPIPLTEANLVSGRYPLDRFLLVYARSPLSPVAREFLRLMLSREGQAAIAASPQRYLPLSAREAAVERSKLD
jgi:phosphate transport system substrate-binding protein